MFKGFVMILQTINFWRFNSDREQHLLGVLYYYRHKHKFKSLGYPLIKYRHSFIRNRHLISMGKNNTIAFNCFISPTELIVGNDCWLGVNNFICGKVKIGNDVHLGPNVCIPGSNHVIDSQLPISKSGAKQRGTIIEDYVWVGSNVTILDGVTIGKGAVVAANSVVTKDIEPWAVVAGVPAKLIKYRQQIL